MSDLPLCKNPRCKKPFERDNPARLYCCEDCKYLNRYALKGHASDDPAKMQEALSERRRRLEAVLRKHGIG